MTRADISHPERTALSERTPRIPDPIGNVPTPSSLARWICRRALTLWHAWGGGRGTGRPPAVLDPAVGNGVFLVEMQRALEGTGERTEARSPRGDPARADLFGLDIQPGAIRLARRVLPDAKLAVGNFLLDTPPGPGRYDIVVGNPPYLGQRDVVRLEYAQALFDRYGFKDDLYVYFVRRSLELLEVGGVLAMVTSDSWLTLMGKEPLRRELLTCRLDCVIRLPLGTFGRRIYTCAFAAVRGAPPGDVWWTAMASDRSGEQVFRPVPGRRVAQSLYDEAPGAVFFDPTPENLRLHRVFGKTLARWRSGLFRGAERSGPLRSGDLVPLQAVVRVSDAGIHSRNCRHRLFSAVKTRPHLKRLLQGRQVERWRVRWACPEARYRWVDITYKPRVGVKGVGRRGRPSRHDEYWDFQGDPRIHHAPERILIRQTGDEIVAALLCQGRRVYYTDNTLFTCLLTDRAVESGLTYRYLLGYLNSRWTNRVYRYLSQERSRRQAQIKVGLLRILPFRVPSRRQIMRVDRLVDRIIQTCRRDGGADLTRLLTRCDTHLESLTRRRGARGGGGDYSN